ncbi:nuclear transport factor 2 family protein [Pseudaquabacterium rugosum]|uniref:Nuclear transport factor 2 family protein n=1 Tax=Pseudaquabacterium rugosum TaxID=2984194 RepID=A0ABU9BCW4_9BURK
MRRPSALLCATLIALAAATSATAAQPAASSTVPSPSKSKSSLRTTAMSANHKPQVTALLKSIETGEAAPVAVINPARYIQHNLAVADGLAGFGAVLQALPKGSARVNTVRVFQDGDFVFAHTEYDFFGPKIGFDIFRFEDGRIVEHWDNLQPTPAAANPSGRTMTDGPTTARDLAHTAQNKALVASFVDDILVNGRMARIDQYIVADHYRQHNPQIADGLKGLGDALAAMAKAGVSMKYQTVHKVLGEGDFVLTVSEGEFAGKPTAFYDLFRVDAGKIVEHWDVIETIAPRSEWKNANGKFGF